jgi:hypothetical protein
VVASEDSKDLDSGSENKARSLDSRCSCVRSCLKCSHLFNILDARGAFQQQNASASSRVRALARHRQGLGRSAEQMPASPSVMSDEPEPVGHKKTKAKKEALSPVG